MGSQSKWVRIKYDGTRFIDDSGDAGNDFVGLSLVSQEEDKDEITLSFPLGYHLNEDQSKWPEDVMLLLSLLSSAPEWLNDEFPEVAEELKENAYPWEAYRWLIFDYGAHGLYRETETELSKAGRGRINWGKTIKAQRAWISNDTPYYLDLIRSHIKLKDQDLITYIHLYCVKLSLYHLGWLYGKYEPRPDKLDEDRKKAFQAVILDKMTHTFKEHSRRLFSYMLKVLEFKDDSPNRLPARFGTDSFHVVWEKMIDQVFGNEDKSKYFPRGKWHLEGWQGDQEAEERDWISDSHLTPDTIMKVGERLFILDAKYYKYGITKKVADLPATSSITKQIIYGEYALARHPDLSGKIYNTYLLPYDKNAETSDPDMKYVGFAYDEWLKEKDKSGWKSYDKIYTFLLDTKTLMQMSLGKIDGSEEKAKLASKILKKEHER